MALNRISANLNQTITLYANGNIDRTGKVTWGSGTAYNCRFEKTTKNIVTKQNELTPIHAKVFLDPDTTVGIGYKATFSSKDYKIITLDELVDNRGRTRHYECYLQEWNQ